ncbi:MAG TPA: hypothetical protein VF663_12020 [Telluria sp.]|jgi:hypothetical protein
MNIAQRWRLRAERAAWRLDQPQALRLALYLVPVLFGLISVAMRQDNNWDLRNYHLYNPFAWLNGKVGIDLAPAQMQTYFNPTIDLLYYGLIKVAPARIAGFVMGTIHGLNFVLLIAIARRLLPVTPRGLPIARPLCLAMAGMLGAGFIAQLGNTMGDNLTALFVLGSLWLVLSHWHTVARGAGLGKLLLAGLVMGLGVGLKLTNGIYAPSLCLALLLVPAAVTVRIRAAFLFGSGVLAGSAITAGHWLWKMWTMFGNPLFPQFNTIFQAPLASPMAVGDLRWMPRGIVENVLWPFIFAMHPERISEIKLSMVVWPILYAGFIALAVTALARRAASSAVGDPLDRSRGNAVLLFVALAYLVWLNLFSIHRYLAPLELLAPLMLWLLAQRLFAPTVAGKAATAAIVLVIACSVQSTNWGRTGWAGQAFSAEVAPIAEPRRSMVLTVFADPPMGWIATFYPRDLAFVSLASGFESVGYRQRYEAMMAERNGPVYLMLGSSDAGDGDARRILAGRGLQFALDACMRYPAYIGRKLSPYRLCPVKRVAPATPPG